MTEIKLLTQIDKMPKERNFWFSILEDVSTAVSSNLIISHSNADGKGQFKSVIQ